MSLAEVENMAALQLFNVGGLGVWFPPGNFGDFRCSEVRSEAYGEAHRAS